MHLEAITERLACKYLHAGNTNVKAFALKKNNLVGETEKIERLLNDEYIINVNTWSRYTIIESLINHPCAIKISQKQYVQGVLNNEFVRKTIFQQMCITLKIRKKEIKSHYFKIKPNLLKILFWSRHPLFLDIPQSFSFHLPKFADGYLSPDCSLERLPATQWDHCWTSLSRCPTTVVQIQQGRRYLIPQVKNFCPGPWLLFSQFRLMIWTLSLVLSMSSSAQTTRVSVSIVLSFLPFLCHTLGSVLVAFGPDEWNVQSDTLRT